MADHKDMKKRHQLPIRFTEGEIRKLELWAAALECSKADVVRRLIDNLPEPGETAIEAAALRSILSMSQAP